MAKARRKKKIKREKETTFLMSVLYFSLSKGEKQTKKLAILAKTAGNKLLSTDLLLKE